MPKVKIQKEINIPDSILLDADSIEVMINDATKLALLAFEQKQIEDKTRVTTSVRFSPKTRAFIESFGEHMGGMSNNDVVVLLVESFIRNSKNRASCDKHS